jgi:hypothetical protein
MENMTVLMVLMKKDADVQPVRPTCLHARMESAFHLTGVVTLIMIALMAVMRMDAVSITSDLHILSTMYQSNTANFIILLILLGRRVSTFTKSSSGPLRIRSKINSI